MCNNIISTIIKGCGYRNIFFRIMLHVTLSIIHLEYDTLCVCGCGGGVCVCVCVGLTRASWVQQMALDLLTARAFVT